MTQALLVRHAQSTWNAEGRWQGQANPPLTDLGRQQATSAASQLSDFKAVVTSPLSRAVETAEILAETLGVGFVTTDEDLMERRVGSWQGLTRAEIEEGWPNFLRDGRRPDGYETNQHVLARVCRALMRVANQTKGGPFLLVTHAGVIYALEGSRAEPLVRIPNLGGRWVELSGGNFRLGKRIELIPEGTVQETL